MNKILFITHDTSRTGAPILLLNFIKWLHQVKQITPLILVGRSDELDEEFSKIGKVFYAYQPKNSIGKNIFYKIYTRIFNSTTGKNLYYNFLKRRLKKLNIDIIYSNTICNGYMMEFLSFLNVQQVCHVHEGGSVIEMWGEDNLKMVAKNVCIYIACSKFVKNVLINKYKIPKEKIELVYESIPKEFVNKYDSNIINENIERYSNKKFSLGGSGGIGHRKGTDLIIPLVKSILKVTPNFSFTWVGGKINSTEFKELNEQILNTGLDKIIKIIAAVENPVDYYMQFDLFILLSREDPFPLVCLENAILGKSILCFDTAGGIPELLEECKENILPFLDIHKMASRILYLMNNPIENYKIGQNLQANILKNYTSDICFPMMYDITQRFSKS